MEKRKNITTFDEYLDNQYGKKGTLSRDNFEQRAEIFRLGVMLEEIRKSKKMTQEQLAKKCGTTKSYISRIENGNSEIRLSTLIRIISQGFGGHLILTVKLKNKISTFKF
jgi:HTH-type transcriptional regulator/antitoxin HipB